MSVWICILHLLGRSIWRITGTLLTTFHERNWACWWIWIVYFRSGVAVLEDTILCQANACRQKVETWSSSLSPCLTPAGGWTAWQAGRRADGQAGGRAESRLRGLPPPVPPTSIAWRQTQSCHSSSSRTTQHHQCVTIATNKIYPENGRAVSMACCCANGTCVEATDM